MSGTFKLPLPLLLLDVIGCILLGLGFAIQFAEASFLPDHLRFESDGIVYIIIGVGCMLPMASFLLKQISRKRGS